MLTLLGIGWKNLKRDRVAQTLTFVLPIVFFSISPACSADVATIRRLACRLPVVDEDQSEFSRRVVEALGKESALRVRAAAPNAPAPRSPRRGAAGPEWRCAGRRRDSEGRRRRLRAAGFAGSGTSIVLLADPSDPVAPQMVQGLLQKVTMTAAPDLMMQGGMKQFERYAGPLTPEQRKSVDEWIPRLKADAATAQAAPTMERPCRCRSR